MEKARKREPPKRRKKAKEPVPTGPGRCRLCPRWEKSKVVCMEGYGPKNPELVLIGEAPAKSEDEWCRNCNAPKSKRCEWHQHRIGMPFVGAAGQVIRKAVTEAGYNLSKTYITNSVRCSAGGAINPTMPEIRRCRFYLLNELASLDWSRCKGVFVLGKSALKSVFNDGKLDVSFTRFKPMELIGPEKPAQSSPEGLCEGRIAPRRPPKREGNTQVAPPQESELIEAPSTSGGVCKIVPEHVPIRVTFHPAAALPHRAPYLYDEIVGDLKTALLPREPVKQVQCVTTIQELDSLYKNTDAVSLDLEWWAKGAVRMVGISDGTKNSAVDSPETILEWLERRCQKSQHRGGDSNAQLLTQPQESLSQLTSKQKQWKKLSRYLSNKPDC